MRIVFIDGMGGGLVAQVISQAAGRRAGHGGNA